MKIDVILLQSKPQGNNGLVWTNGAIHRIEASAATVEWRLCEILPGTDAEYFLFWDAALGQPNLEIVMELAADNTVDVFHCGLKLGTTGEPGDIDFVRPTWMYNRDVALQERGVSWRLSLRACLIRTKALKILGCVDGVFESLDAAALDMGYRYITHGAVIIYTPQLLEGGMRFSSLCLSRKDSYRFFVKNFKMIWANYVFFRRVLGNWSFFREAVAYRAAVLSVRNRAASRYENIFLAPDTLRSMPGSVNVSVVIPTLSRYHMLEKTIRSLQEQTVKPLEIICVDQTPRQERDRGFYAKFKGCAVVFIEQDERGQGRARNTGMRIARGEYILSFDDDAVADHYLIEKHLVVLHSYNADASIGISLRHTGEPLPLLFQHLRISEIFDTGNALFKRSLFDKIGGFDLNYDGFHGGDHDFGMRIYMQGGLIILNPLAPRLHFKRQQGGIRAHGAGHPLRPRSLFSPRPHFSIVYQKMLYYSKRQVREGILLDIVLGVLPHHRATISRLKKIILLAKEFLWLPFTFWRVQRSIALAKKLFDKGPQRQLR